MSNAVMVELAKMRVEQRNLANLIVSIQLAAVLGGTHSIPEIMERTSRMIADQLVD